VKNTGFYILGAIEFEARAKYALSRLGLGHWQVAWLPDISPPIRGRAIPEKLLIEIYDIDDAEAWNTFLHEVVEIKLRSALRPYRILVNKLLDGYQEIADKEKDNFIEGLPEIFEVFRASEVETSEEEEAQGL
jgi:hypothetical protein